MSNVATGKITDYGHAPYKNDPNNQQSFFVEIENKNGTKSQLWGLGLEDALKQNSDIKKGDTVALLDKGIIEGSRKREWEIEKYEPLIEHKNSIENDTEKKIDQNINTAGEKAKENEQVFEFKKDNLKNELDIPESIRNNYVAMVRNRLFGDEKINFYDKNDNTSIAFEDRKNSLNTSRNDEKTIKAMIDVAESKSWSSVSLKGTEEFKQKAWLEASLRGIETKGYNPTEKDLAELKAKQEERTNNAVQHEGTRIVEPLPLDQSKDLELKQDKDLEQDIKDLEPSLDNEPLQDKDIEPEIDTSSLPLNQDEDKDSNKIQEYLAFANKIIDQASIGQTKITTDRGEVLQSDRLKLVESEFKALVENSNMPDYAKQNHIEEMAKKIKDVDALTASIEDKRRDGEDNYKGFLNQYDAAYGKPLNSVEASWNEKIGVVSIDNDQSKDKQIEIANSISPFQNTKEVKEHIDQMLKEKIATGEIKDRQDVVNALKENGFNVLKEETKTISIENPIGNRNIRLQGDMYDKDFKNDIENEKLVNIINTFRDELPQQEQGVTHKTGIGRLMVTLDNYKDKIEQKDLIAVEAYKTVIQEKYKDNPEKMNQRLDALSAKIPDIAAGKFNLPEPPTVKQQVDIDVSVSKQGDQDRGR